MSSLPRPAKNPPDGYLLLNKKPGITSFDSLGDVKRTFGTGKAGHTGTLDKFASGLLVVLVGRGAKLAFLFDNFVKEYTGTITFGTETDTLDPEGAVTAQGPIPGREALEEALEHFRGDILQAPPAYSALHINGRRAHELAREGKEPEMKKRPVTIHDLELVSWTPPEAVIRAKVSAGTYIRSLARDIALVAGSRAYLSSLKRSGVGPFRLEDADGELRPLDVKLFEALSLPCFFLGEREAEAFRHGKPLENILPASDAVGGATGGAGSSAVGVFRKDAPDRLLGVLEQKNNKWVYGHVFADN